MQLQTYAKIGILIGITAVIIFLPFWMVVTVAENEALFAEFFFNENLVEKKMKETKTYKAMLERFPDSIVQLRSHGPFNSDMEITAYNNNSDSRLTARIGFDHQNDFTWESARCTVSGVGSLRDKLGTTPSELIDNNPPIPKYLFKEGNADNAFTSEFIKFTNCLEIGNDPSDVTPEIVAPEYGDFPTYTISVPQGSSVPGCEEIAHCFEPEEITIKVGEVIEWKNYDDSIHTITSGDPQDGPSGLFDSGVAEPDATYALKFNTPGEFPYFCMIHPWQEGMITVTE